MQFSTRSSPFIPATISINRVMRQVVYALLPAIGVMIWLYGAGVLIQLILACSTALIAESICLALRKRSVLTHLADLSALVSALLLALALPTLAPWWVTVFGALFAILIGKQAYGGLGYNPFNPTMAGYIFVLISFPLQMTNWQMPATPLSFSAALPIIFCAQPAADGLTGATILDAVKTHISTGLTLPEISTLPEINQLADNGLRYVIFAYGIGGLWLLYKKIISWHIPFAVILGLCLPQALAHVLDASRYNSAIFHLLSGATIYGAFFIATDPVTAASSSTGRLIYGLLIGMLIFVIRNWGGYPDAIAFAVLLANLAAPSIDVYTRPKIVTS